MSEDVTRLKKSNTANAKTQNGGDTGDSINSLQGAIGGHDEITECQLCAEEVSYDGHFGQKAIMCQKCATWTHQACANLNNQEMKALDKGRHNIMWFCNSCTPDVAKMIKGKTKTSMLASEASSMVEVVKKLDEVVEKLNKLTEAMEKREGNIEVLIETKVNRYMDEKGEREKRECNVVFHNIPECTSEDTELRKKFDEERVDKVLDYLEIDEQQDCLKPVRLGKRSSLPGGRPRLMKVTLNSASTRKKVLSKAKTLRNCRDDNLSFIYITPDMTPKEREDSKRLREEMKKRRLDGESVVIRGGKIVPDNRSSFRTEPGVHQGTGEL